MPPAPTVAVVELMPEKAGLLFIYVVSGCFGGLGAAFYNSGSGACPSLWTIVQKALVGAAAGFATGCGCLAKLGAEDKTIYWSMLLSFSAGFAPVTLWKALIRFKGESRTPS